MGPEVHPPVSPRTTTLHLGADSPVVAAEGIEKRYGATKAVDGVSLSVGAGRCYALLGPNGAGKSTLSRVLGGVAPRDGGALSVFGMDPAKEPSEVKSRIGWVMQEDALDDELDVAGNLAVWGRFYGMAGGDVRERSAELLRLVGLEGRERSAIQALSGGMRRRLVIARALLSRPDMLILDEPTTGLDPQVRHAIWALMRSLKGQGRTLLLTTHYMEEAAQMADVTGILFQGKLVAEGAPQDLVRRHVKGFALEVREAEAGTEGRIDLPGGPDATIVRRHGDLVIAYHDDESALRAAVVALASRSSVVRPASLEDVFLELTGRSLDG